MRHPIMTFDYKPMPVVKQPRPDIRDPLTANELLQLWSDYKEFVRFKLSQCSGCANYDIGATGKFTAFKSFF